MSQAILWLVPCKIKTRENASVECRDYQIPVTQLLNWKLIKVYLRWKGCFKIGRHLENSQKVEDGFG